MHHNPTTYQADESPLVNPDMNPTQMVHNIGSTDFLSTSVKHPPLPLVVEFTL